MHSLADSQLDSVPFRSWPVLRRLANANLRTEPRSVRSNKHESCVFVTDFISKCTKRSPSQSHRRTCLLFSLSLSFFLSFCAIAMRYVLCYAPPGCLGLNCRRRLAPSTNYQSLRLGLLPASSQKSISSTTPTSNAHTYYIHTVLSRTYEAGWHSNCMHIFSRARLSRLPLACMCVCVLGIAHEVVKSSTLYYLRPRNENATTTTTTRQQATMQYNRSSMPT